MIMLLSVMVIMGFHLYSCTESDASSDGGRTSFFINGDFIVGALFPIHYAPDFEKKRFSSRIECGAVREQYGIQRVEVALQTIDNINNDPTILPNITLGIEIRDECWYAPVALQESIELIRDALPPRSRNSDFCATNSGVIVQAARSPLVGVIGPASSSVALQVQNLLQLFQIPQIGYSATSKDLSDKIRFNFFLRVVPSDYYQAQVMLEIVKHHGWTYVSVVNTDENYGQSGIQAFRELALSADVCIAQEDSVLSSDSDERFKKVILKLKQDPKARVVVCFCEGITVKKLLKATKTLNLSNYFLFIGSDGWADRNNVVEGYESEAWGGISIRIYSPYVEDFDSYYLSRNPYTNKRNPWFKELWETKFNCSLDNTVSAEDIPTAIPTFPNLTTMTNKVIPTPNSSIATSIIGNKLFGQDRKIFSGSGDFPRCTGNESLKEIYRQDPKLSFVVRAIYTFAHALDVMHRNVCGSDAVSVCEKMSPLNGTEFKNYLMNVSFTYKDTVIEFDENGDPPARYDILNYQKIEEGKFDYVLVGNWNNGTLRWTRDLQFGPNESVKSVCSDPCAMGYYKNIQSSGKDKRCCWVCLKCARDHIVVNDSNSQSCVACKNGSRPDRTQTKCIDLPIDYVTWNSIEAIIALSIAILGIILSSATLAIFIKYSNTPVVKSSTKELSYIILIGTLISYSSVLPILSKPSSFTCGSNRFVPSLSFAMIYSALLTKTNRISRILAGSKKKIPTRKPLFMSAAAQVIITLILIAMEVFISLAILLYESPKTSKVYLPHKTILECHATPLSVIGPLIFDFFLIFMCTCYAVKTRNVPENFNEAKFIGFAMYTTCVIWLAFVPLYFGSNAKVITECLCITLSALVTWTFLFAPKLYIILFRPEKNNRAFFTTNKNIRCHIGCRVSSALSDKTSLNSWRESCLSYKDSKSVPEKRTLSCQTSSDLLEILLNPTLLNESKTFLLDPLVPRITERDCCDCGNDDCQIKKITIKIPNNLDDKLGSLSIK